MPAWWLSTPCAQCALSAPETCSAQAACRVAISSHRRRPSHTQPPADRHTSTMSPHAELRTCAMAELPARRKRPPAGTRRGREGQIAKMTPRGPGAKPVASVGATCFNPLRPVCREAIPGRSGRGPSEPTTRAPLTGSAILRQTEDTKTGSTGTDAGDAGSKAGHPRRIDATCPCETCHSASSSSSRLPARQIVARAGITAPQRDPPA